MQGKSWTSVAVASAVLVGALALLYLVPAAADNRWGADYFPNVPLITQDGVTVRFYDDLLKGKAVAVNAIYTSCKDECPLETARLVQVQRLLGNRVGKDIFFYSISIDPKRDTPEVLKAYAEKFHVGPGWTFLTGQEGDIKLITRKLGLSRSGDAAERDGHRAILMIGDVPGGQWMKNSAVDNPKFLVRTMMTFFGWNDPNPGKSYAEARPLTLDKGEYVFRTRCSACHTIGHGDGVGPDLAGVTTRRDRGWLTRYLAQPERMLAEGDPIATELFAKYRNIPMPNLGLAQEEITAVLAHLQGQSSASHDHERQDSASTR